MNDPATPVSYLDDIVEEFAQRWRRGERPSVDEYAARHPEYASDIREVLPALILMEELKPQRGEATAMRPRGGRSTPGRLGDYRLVREIGRGGMGIVYEAEQLELGRRVAIKVLLPHLLTDDKLRHRFRREAQAAARLHHTNIVPVFGVGEQDGFCYYAMQLIEGQSLAEVIKQRGQDVRSGTSAEAPVTEAAEQTAAVVERADPACATFDLQRTNHFRETAQFGLQVAQALAYAHAHRIVHRDIKPSNLLLDESGTVWITDFGVAKLVADHDLTSHGELVGTLKYMPPERFRGVSDARGDVYSLGITLYEMLAGRPAFPDATPDNLMVRIAHQEPPSLRAFSPRLPRDLETIVLKAIARDPEQRYQTADDLADDLRRFLDDEPIRARRTTALGHLWRWCRRNRLVASLAATAVLLLALVAAVSAAAYLHTVAANRDTTKALTAEQEQRAHAEATSALALQALDRLYDRMAPNRVVVVSKLPVESADGGQVEILIRPVLAREAIPVAEELLVFYERVAGLGGNYAKLRAQAADANHRIGDIRQGLGQLEQATLAYTRAITMYRQIQYNPARPEGTRLHLARSHNELGRVYRALQQREAELGAHAEAMECLHSIPAEQRTQPGHRYELARTYYFLARQETLPGEPPPMPRPAGPGKPRLTRPGKLPARGRFASVSGMAVADHCAPETMAPERNPLGEAQRLLEGLVKEYPSIPDYRHLLACCYRDTAPPHGFPERAVEILQQLADDCPEVPDYRYDLSETYARVDPNSFATPELTALALERLENARRLSRRLVSRYPGVTHYAASLAHIHYKLGLLLRRQKQYEESERVLRDGVFIQAGVLRRSPDVAANSYVLAVLETALALTLMERGEWPRAQGLLETAVERHEELRKRPAPPRHVHGSLASTYRNLAKVLTQLNEPEKAAEAQRRADELHSMPPKKPDHHHHNDRPGGAARPK